MRKTVTQICVSCGRDKSECTTCDGNTGKVEIIADIMLNAENIGDGDLLTGKRFENQYMYNYIKDNYQHIGIGLCKRLGKQVDLYRDNFGNLYGVSKVLPYRYFDLRMDVMGESK